jgi:hypothetical protein
VALVIVATAFGLGAIVTTAEAKPITAQFIDETWLKPHHSAITGDFLLDAARWYGLPARAMLTVMGAETSMGDPALGGHLVEHNNFSCIRSYPGYQDTKWGKLANGTVWVAGKEWLSFPTMEAGVMAVGRLMKLGPRDSPGTYKRTLVDRDWPAFAHYWFGATVPGLTTYIANLRDIDATLAAKARKAGYEW